MGAPAAVGAAGLVAAAHPPGDPGAGGHDVGEELGAVSVAVEADFDVEFLLGAERHVGEATAARKTAPPLAWSGGPFEVVHITGRRPPMLQPISQESWATRH